MTEVVPSGAPCAGRFVILTRSRNRLSGLSAEFAKRGATVLELPLFKLAAGADELAAGGALAQLKPGGWIICTSANAVDAAQRIGAEGLARARVAAVGPATAAAAERLGCSVTVLPEQSSGAALAAAMAAFAPEEAIFLRGRRWDPALPQLLGGAGWRLHSYEVYAMEREIPGASAIGELRSALESGRAAVVLLSQANAEAFFEVASNAGSGVARLEATLAIGPKLAERCRALGFREVLAPQENSAARLPDLFAEWCARRPIRAV